MGHHLPSIHANILHRKNTGQCPICLEVRKLHQCRRPMDLPSDTDNNHISKTQLTLSIRFCDKVTTLCHRWGNTLTRALLAPVGSWASATECSYVPCTLIKPCPCPLFIQWGKRFANQNVELKLHEGGGFCLFCSPMNLMDLEQWLALIMHLISYLFNE